MKNFKITKLTDTYLVTHKSGFKMSFKVEQDAMTWIQNHIKYNTKF